MNEQALIDLRIHFANKLRNLVADTSQTCLFAEIEQIDIIAMIMSSLAYELVLGAVILKMDEEQFLQLNTVMYKFALKEIRRKVAAMKKTRR